MNALPEPYPERMENNTTTTRDSKRALHILIIFVFLAYAIQSMGLQVQVYVNGHSICGQPLGSIGTGVSGGVPPYTYAWSNGTTQSYNNGLTPGTYSLVVTDAVGATATGSGVIQNLPSYPTSTFETLGYCNTMFPTALFYAGVQNGIPPDPMSGTQHGPGPYQFTSPNFPPLHYGEWVDCTQGFSYYAVGAIAPPGANVVVNYTDGLGCPGSFTFVVPPPLVFPSVQVTNISGSCSNGAIGSATLSVGVLGDQPKVRYRLKRNGQVVQLGDCGWVLYDSPTTHDYTGLAAGTYWVVADMDVYGIRNDVQVPCADSISFVIPDLGITCGLVSGRIYVDNNANCVANTGENNVPNTIIEITPGPYYTTTNLNGNYSVTLPYGTYQFTEQSPAVQQSCPLSVTLASASLTNRHIGVAGGMPLDARVLIANGPARPGFDLLYVIDVENLTTATTGAVTLTVQADPALIPVSTQPTASASGNTFTWNLSMAGAFQRRVIHLRMRVPPDVNLMGSTLTTTASITTANTDVNLANNAALSQQVVTGSYDPNDKLVNTTAGLPGVFLMGQDDWLDYTIRFQNTGTDTAFTVVITDTLPTTLDPATVIWGPTSHTCTKAILSNGVLRFTHNNILLPDSNVNEARSHGFVNFRIKTRQPVLPGVQISNIANIYFDFNPPVITDPSILTITAPGVALSPKVLLGGPYVEATQRMNDDLRTLGLLPLTEPYTSLGYPGGGVSATPAALAVTGDDAVVDWVLVELRSATAPYPVIATRSALLQRDGDVVTPTGTGPLLFTVAAGNYRVAVRHRNHLGCMTNAAVALGATPTTVDLSVATTITYGTNARKAVATRRVLWPGNVNGDDRVMYVGAQNDRDLVLQRIGGTVPTNSVTGFLLEDIDLDGQVKYTGTANDRDLILQSIGGVVPTNVLFQQLP